MQALILVGGEGTRLRPLTNNVPKPALPLCGKPFLAYMLEWLGEHGVDDVVLACGFEPAALRAAIGDGDADQRISYVVEPEPRGTGGAVRFAEKHLAERFLVLNGDVLTDLDISALVARHRESGALGTLGLFPVDDATGYGVVPHRDNGEVIEFREKPDPEEARQGGEINAGIYVLEHAVLELIAPDREVSIEREVFPEMIGRGLYASGMDGYWMDIGTPERFLQASWDILERRVDTTVGRRVPDSGVLVEEGADVDPAATLTPPAMVAAGAKVATGANVGPRAVVGVGAQIAAGAGVEGSLLGENCKIGENAAVTGAILAPGAEVAADGALEPGQVIGEGELVGSPR